MEIKGKYTLSDVWVNEVCFLSNAVFCMLQVANIPYLSIYNIRAEESLKTAVKSF